MTCAEALTAVSLSWYLLKVLRARHGCRCKPFPSIQEVCDFKYAAGSSLEHHFFPGKNRIAREMCTFRGGCPGLKSVSVSLGWMPVCTMNAVWYRETGDKLDNTG